MTLLAQFSKKRDIARKRYAEFVTDGKGTTGLWQALKGQIFRVNYLVALRFLCETCLQCSIVFR